jgi:hypothetical protein
MEIKRTPLPSFLCPRSENLEPGNLFLLRGWCGTSCRRETHENLEVILKTISKIPTYRFMILT